jgi:peptidoglycan/LPS O-acetylase OafA/YrhL
MFKAAPHLLHPKHRPDIDGLRAVAILPVVTFHAFPDFLPGGFIGVDIFFVISGYLISIIIFENLNKGTFSFAEFYARRVKRIFPALSVVMATGLVLGWFVLLADEYKQLGKHVAGGAAFVSNFVLLSEVGYFDNLAETKPFLNLWSLSVEEQYYLIYPLVIWFSFKRKYNLLMVLGITALLSLLANALIVQVDEMEAFYMPYTRFWELMLGGIVAWVSVNSKIKHHAGALPGYVPPAFVIDKNQSGKPIQLANIYSLIGISLLIFGFYTIHKDIGFPGYWALIPVLGTMCIIIAGPSAWINKKVLGSRWLVGFGLISYPLYLWHWMLLSFVRIVESGVPSENVRIQTVLLSIVLAWLTVKLIENPFRLGSDKPALKVAVLSAMIFTLAIIGFTFEKPDFSEPRSFENLVIKRKSWPTIGSSLNWFRGKDDWLFLGNSYDKTVSKLELSIIPDNNEIESTKEIFSKIVSSTTKHGTQVALIVAPNKSSIYPEYLPDEIIPSQKRYISFYLEKIKEVPGLAVYDPTSELISMKSSEGFLYWMTDTHWNSKGAFVAYKGFSRLFNLPTPIVEFKHGTKHRGDLIIISELKYFPLHPEDNWEVVWKDKPAWSEIKISDKKNTAFGAATIVKNKRPLSNKTIWVVGDSFTGELRQYFNATFNEVHYIGHWVNKLQDLPSDFARADKKPDLIVIVRVERSF